MKKVILIAAAATMFAVPANAAPGGRDHRARVQKVEKERVAQRTNRSVVQARNVYRQPVQVRNVYRQPVLVKANRGHQWSRGQRFDRRYATNYRVIDNYRAYNLNTPPYGYRYVQSNNDIVLVAIASGIIGAVFGNLL
jgi:Ni/Co efflux regulator RcnB